MLLLLLLLKRLLDCSASAAGSMVDKNLSRTRLSSSILLHLLLFDFLTLLGSHRLTPAQLFKESLLLDRIGLLLFLLWVHLLLHLLLLLYLLLLSLFAIDFRHAFFLHGNERWLMDLASWGLTIVHGLLGSCKLSLLRMALSKFIARGQSGHSSVQIVVLLLLLDSWNGTFICANHSFLVLICIVINDTNSKSTVSRLIHLIL